MAYKSIKPDLVHYIIIKPIIYGSLASRLLNIKTVNTICGLGYAFNNSKMNIKNLLALLGYKLALQTPNSFHFFENKEDRSFFIDKNTIVKNANNIVVNGVDLNKYKPLNRIRRKESKIVITLTSRMLWEKV